MSGIFVEPGHWLWGNARELARAPHEFPAKVGRQGGGIGQLRVLHQNILSVSHAEYARQVLVTHHEHYQRARRYLDSIRSVVGRGLLSTEGPEWLAHRRQMLPAFRRERLSRLPNATHEAASSLMENWETERRAGRAIPLAAAMQELTMQVMARALLSTRLGEEQALRFGAAVRDALVDIRARNNTRLRLPLWIPLGANKRLMRTKRALDQFVLQHIEDRQKQAGRQASRQADAGALDMLDSLRASHSPDTGRPFDDGELRDETKTLFVAGFETTAATLTWALYSIARHPETASAWHNEIDKELNGRAPGWGDIDRLHLTRAILRETMRVYPPVYNLPRVCVREDRLAGHRIRPGTIVLVSIFAIHRSADYWPEPEVFRPERFLPGARFDPHAFLPFGAGKHTCIGADFALAEMTMALAALGQRYRFSLADPAPVGMTARITLVPDREIGLYVTPRACM